MAPRVEIALPYAIAKPARPSFALLQSPSFRSPQPQPASRLLNLPVELLLRVLDQAQNLGDTLLLGLTCTYMWNISWQYFVKIIFRQAGLWRGARVTYERDKDPPPWLLRAFLSAEKRDRLNAELEKSGSYSYCSQPIQELSVKALFISERSTISPSFGLPHGLRDVIRYNTDLPLLEWGRVHAFMTAGVSAFYPLDEDWTLRNLTAKSYVRGNRLNAAFHPYKRSTGLMLPYPGLGEVIRVQICGALHPSSRFWTHNGEWAGHRLEILRDDEHFAACDATWTDATGEIVQRLSRVLRLKAQEPEEGDTMGSSIAPGPPMRWKQPVKISRPEHAYLGMDVLRHFMFREGTQKACDNWREHCARVDAEIRKPRKLR